MYAKRLAVIVLSLLFVFSLSCCSAGAKSEYSLNYTSDICSGSEFKPFDSFTWYQNYDAVIKKLPNNELLNSESKSFDPMRASTDSKGYPSVTPKLSVKFDGVGYPFSLSMEFTPDRELFMTGYILTLDASKTTEYASTVKSMLTALYAEYGNADEGQELLEKIDSVDYGSERINVVWNLSDTALRFRASPPSETLKVNFHTIALATYLPKVLSAR